MGTLDHESRCQPRQGNDENGDEGHLPADGEHHNENADDGGHGSDDLRQTLIEGLVDGFDIVGEIGKHFAVSRVVKITEGEPVHLGESLFSEFIGHADGDLTHQKSLNGGKCRGSQIQHNQAHHNLSDGGKINAFSGIRDNGHQPFENFRCRAAQNFGTDDVKNRRRNGKNKDDDNPDFISAQIREEFFEGSSKILCFFGVGHTPGAGTASSASGHIVRIDFFGHLHHLLFKL